MILGMVGIHLFHLVDTFFVGRLGTQELAAMSFTFPVVFVIQGMSLGLGMGASAVISRAIGEGDWGRVRRLTTDSLALAFLIVAFLIVVGLFTIDPVFRLMGATDEVMPLIRSYMLVWYPGMIFVVMPMVGNDAIRATGDTRTPGLIMITAACVNGVLDPLFIFGIGPFPRLELAGAALATVIGRSITFTLALLILSRRERMLTRSFPGLRALWDSWKDILHVGLPSALTNILIPVGIGVITRIVSGYGAAAVAGFGVATRIETFALTPVMALRSVVAPFVGQNWGARRHDRLRRGVAISGGFSVAWGLLVWLILALTGRHIAAVFNDSPDVIATTSLYLLIVPAAYGMRGVLYLSTGALSVLRKPVDAAVLMLVQIFVLYVPLAMLGSRLLELRGVFGAGLISNVVAGAVAYLWTRRIVALRHSEELVRSADVPMVDPTAGGI
ncbi:MAG: MATE family efflux transporter [Candidatus Eisenbacteria bacterium]